MLFKQEVLQGIAQGRITVAFRRWKRPSVKAGGRLTTSVGVLQIQSVEPIDEEQITRQAIRRAGCATLDELLASLGDRDGQLYRIEFVRAGDDPRIELREKGVLSGEDLTDLRRRLARLDQHSRRGPWTAAVLKLLEQHPAQRAAELARQSGFEKEWLKTNVRKLKNLGLTESLEVGYRLSPRGQAFVQAARSE